MEENIANFLKDAFPETEANFEHLHSDVDVNVPQNDPDMEDDNGHRESSGSESDIDLEWGNREEEIKNFSENRNFSLDEQSMKAGPMLCGSRDDDDTDENNTQTQNQQLSLHDEECIEKEVEKHADLHQMNKEQAEDVSMLEMLLPKGPHYDLETMSPETPSHLPKKHGTPLMPEASMEVQSGDEMKEFTEEDHENREREEEGLAEYPSDLSQSDSGDSSEGGQPNHMDTKLPQVQVVDLGCSYEMKNLEEPPLNYKVVTSRNDDVQMKDGCMDPVDMLTYEGLNVETPGKSDDDIMSQTKQDSIRDDEYNSEISNTEECSDFGISANFQSNSSESYMTEQPDYDSDISSDGEYCKTQEESPDFNSHLILQGKDFNRDRSSIEHEIEGVVVTDSQKEVCDMQFSSNPASPKGGIEGSSENRSESHPLEGKNNKEHDNSEHSESSDFGENINTLLPGTFWSFMDDHNLELGEYDWDIDEKEVICDEEEYFQDELENDEEETKGDWEKEKARIEAFNRFYQPAEGEENKGRIHKVTFCLDPESSLYEVDSDSSEEELSTKGCISDLESPESSSVKEEQSNMEDGHESSEVSYIENFSTLQMDDEDMNFDEYHHDINVEFYKMNSNEVICDDQDDFLEKLKNEIERDMEQERAKNDRYYEESVEEKQKEDRTHRAMFRLDQGSSQNEEDNDSSEQESNSEDDTANVQKTELSTFQDQSDSDEPHERRLYAGRYKVLPKELQKAGKELKEHPKRNKCVVLLRSVLAVSLASVVGLLSYCWANDSLDWIY
ncbi:protein starmaker isoform X4 [Pimephales promelas]|uniref:protein starmaker isoform X4 n=1 Tax=Pimephales promelas TaxID=90988 RepID=UPI0019557446|nr:protein starmaker isoform X4 [Pimephales promelas]